MPPPGIQAQRPCTRTAREHNKTMARWSLLARPIWKEKSSLAGCRVQRAIGVKCVVSGYHVLFCHSKLSPWQAQGEVNACCRARNEIHRNAFVEVKER